MKHEIECRECGWRMTVDYDVAKEAERGELEHVGTDGSGCGGEMRRVWGVGGISMGRAAGSMLGDDL